MYLLLDYGDFTDSTADSTYPSYARLLSATNPAEAHADFVATRLNGQDTTSSWHYNTGSGNTSFFQWHRISVSRWRRDGRIGAHGRCMAHGETAQARVPPAVRPCPLGDMPMQNVMGTAPGRHILTRGQARHNVGLGIHPLAVGDLFVYVSPCWLRTETCAG